MWALTLLHTGVAGSCVQPGAALSEGRPAEQQRHAPGMHTGEKNLINKRAQMLTNIYQDKPTKIPSLRPPIGPAGCSVVWNRAASKMWPWPAEA